MTPVHEGGSADPRRSMSLIVSSMSARGRSLTIGREMVEILRGGGWTVTVHVTNSTSDVEYEASQSEAPFVGALGGDGYLSAAARGCIGGAAPLLPFPGGRGNDLCRALGIGPDAMRWAQRLARAKTEEVESWVRPLDAMQVSSPDGKYVVLGVISVGVDATANQIANRSWFRSGPVAYAWGASVAALGKYRKLDVGGSIDGVVPQTYPGQERDAGARCGVGRSGERVGVFHPEMGGWLTSISNSGWFGGGINILPQSKTDDGILEVITVDSVLRPRAIVTLAKVLATRQLDDPIVHVYEGTKIRLETPAGLQVMADGDVIGQLPMDIEVLPAALNVVGPPADPESQLAESAE